MGCGAVIGGGINDRFGWRWAFLVLAPISTLASIGVGVFLPRSTSSNTSLRKQLGRIDYGGSITLVSSLALLLIYLNHDDSQMATSGLATKAFIVLSAVFFALFVVIELRWSREPIIPLTLFRNPTVLAACLCSLLMAMTIYTLMFYVPLYLQLRGYSTSQTGVRLLPESVGGGLGSFVVGFVTRRTGKYSALKIILPILIVLGTAGFAVITIDASSVLPEFYLFFNGFGFGGLLTVLLLALLSAVPHSQQATSTSALLAFRSIGSTVGLSVAGVVFRSRLNGQAPMNATQHGHPQSHQLQVGDGSDRTADVYMSALHGTFLLALGLAIPGFICAIFVKNYSLRSAVNDDEVTVSNNDGE